MPSSTARTSESPRRVVSPGRPSTPKSPSTASPRRPVSQIVDSPRLPPGLGHRDLEAERLKIEAASRLIAQILNRKPPPSKYANSKKNISQFELRRIAVLDIQRCYRGFRARKEYRSRLKMQSTRARIVNEMLTTEESYVECLDTIVNVFVKPLREHDPQIISSAQIQMIFSNVEVIRSYNSIMLMDLKAANEKFSVHTRVGKIFLMLCDYLKVYTDFVSNYPTSLQAMTTFTEEVPEFRRFLRRQFRSLKRRYSRLDEYLITPVQRIPRYELLLREMLKYTWKSHCDYADLEAAFLKTQEISTYVNERAREAEAMAKVFEIQEDLVNVDARGLVAPGRRFIRDGPMSMVVRDKRGRQKLEPVHGVLFNDVFLVCSLPLPEKAKTDKAKTKTDEKAEVTPLSPRRDRRMVLHAIEPASFAGSGVINQQDEEFKNCFELVVPEMDHSGRPLVTDPSEPLTEYIFSLSSPELKSKWLKALNRQIRRLSRETRQRDKRKLKVASAKADQVKAILGQQYTHMRVRGSWREMQAQKMSTSPRSTDKLEGESPRTWSTTYQRMTPTQKLDASQEAKQNLDTLLEEEKARQAKIEKEKAAKAAVTKMAIRSQFGSLGRTGSPRRSYREARSRAATLERKKKPSESK